MAKPLWGFLTEYIVPLACFAQACEAYEATMHVREATICTHRCVKRRLLLLLGVLSFHGGLVLHGDTQWEGEFAERSRCDKAPDVTHLPRAVRPIGGAGGAAIPLRSADHHG